ncbi:hypothetical protein VU12_08125 [Desulfobulbus sp. US4]|nr:hypothetical protein [Desulfobulbus sp. US4]
MKKLSHCQRCLRYCSLPTLRSKGKISIGKLQAGYAAVLGMTMHTDAIVWRRAQLRRKPIAKLLEEV